MNDEDSKVLQETKTMLNSLSVQALCSKAFIERFNTATIQNWTHEAIQQHIADLEDLKKMLQAEIQAVMNLDEERSKSISAAERASLREKDRAYRARQRPATNADGTIADKKPRTSYSGLSEREKLIARMMKTGMSRENVEKLIDSMGPIKG